MLRMRFVIVLILTILKTCDSSVLFQIISTNDSIQINSSYLFGTVHVSNNLIWPYLSNETLRILNESNQVWAEHDFINSNISELIYKCTIEKMSIKERSRLRAKTWARFLNETKEKYGNQSNSLNEWKNWVVRNELVSNNYLWRNRTIDNSIIFDHRILLEAYQRNAHVGSLESIPNDCFQIEEKKPSKESSNLIYEILSRTYNCDIINDDFIREISKNLNFEKMKKRNEQITQKIRQLLTNDSQPNYLFVVGAAHLFGNISIVQMLENQYDADYSIRQIDSPSPNFPYQTCTDEEFEKLIKQMNSIQNVTITKRSVVVSELFN